MQQYLHDTFRKAMQTAEWKEFVAKSGLTQDYANGPAFQKEIVEAYDLIGKAIARESERVDGPAVAEAGAA